jgi:hypothetical protein
LALADGAFINKFTSLAQIYNLVVPSDTDRIRLKWDDELGCSQHVYVDDKFVTDMFMTDMVVTDMFCGGVQNRGVERD